MHYETDFKRIRNKVENYAEDYTYLNTLEYLFYYIGGVHIFVHIKNNDLLFLPFVNIKYRNDWKTDLSKNDAVKIMKKTKKHYKKIKPVRNWRLNGCLVALEDFKDPSKNNVPIIEDMLLEMLNNYDIQDCSFFINRSDFPVLRKDRKQPFPHPNLKYLPKKWVNRDYAPIFSMCTTDKHEDIPIPTYEDWKTIQDPIKWEKIKWENKENVALFRGSSTGCSTDPKINKRLIAYNNSKKYGDQYNIDVDVDITKWVKRIKMNKGKLTATYKPKGSSTDFIPMEEQSNFKFLINIEGNAAAFRLPSLLNSGSTILNVKSKYKLWIEEFMEDGIHYNIVSATDLSSECSYLMDKELSMKKIAKNAKKLYRKRMSKYGLLGTLRDIIEDSLKLYV